jgi:hypothetical protein
MRFANISSATEYDHALSLQLLSVLPEIAVQLCSAVWSGLDTREPQAPHIRRARLEHGSKLVVKAKHSTYAVAAHLFEDVGHETDLHDHRYPLAVFPFAVDGNGTDPLYEMQWVEVSTGAKQTVVVRSGESWAVAQPTQVKHTVKSLRPHASIVLADVTNPPTRAQRLEVDKLLPEEITRVRCLLRDSLAVALGERLPRLFHDSMAEEQRMRELLSKRRHE